VTAADFGNTAAAATATWMHRTTATAAKADERIAGTNGSKRDKGGVQAINKSLITL
jgi:hypothetical protein